MKRVYLFLIAIALVSTVFGQKKHVDVYRSSSIVIDGDESDWEGIDPVLIETTVPDEVATVGVPYWKAAYDDEYIYVLVNVAEDDSHYPSWISGGYSWTADKVEVYFDVNEELVDGLGTMHGAGHYQFAESMREDTYDVETEASDANIAGTTYCYSRVGDNGYLIEYKIPMSVFVNDEGDEMDLESLRALPENIGFDVTVNDLDVTAPRARVNWANDYSIDESYVNMDGCGTISLVEATAVNDILDISMDVYPNPVSNVLTIGNSFDKVVFMNIVGQVVKTIETSSNRVDVSDLSSGIYIIKAYENGVFKRAAKITKY
ncbi:sugar-binding protein [Geofilum sp. OHC36d9]|uniref:sugar-binding protein n=1 Tax=Geofilum sp. OHC36d9 TaxID=3458413 RepID=UPI004033D8FD